MKRSTEKELLFAAGCAALYLGAYLLLIKPIFYQNYVGYFQAFLLLMYFFGVIASLFPFRGTRRARVAIGTIAFSTALILSWRAMKFFAVVLPLLRTPDTNVIILGIQLSSWQFLMLLVVLAIIALGFSILGLWILKKRD